MGTLSDGTWAVLRNTASKLTKQGQKRFWARIQAARDFKEMFGIILEIEESLKEDSHENVRNNGSSSNGKLPKCN